MNITRILLLWCLQVGVTLALDRGADLLRFDAGTIIAPGFRLTEDHNTDTSVVTGALISKETNFRIQFSIFTDGFIFAEPAERKRNGSKIIWSRHSGRGFDECWATLVEEPDKTRTIFVSLPKRGPANFVAEVDSSQEANKQIEQVSKIALSFRPNRQNSNRGEENQNKKVQKGV